MRKGLHALPAFILALASCGMSETFSFAQESLKLCEEESFDLSKLIYSSIDKKDIAYSVSDSKVAELSGSTLTGKTEGKATVTASSGSYTASIEVEVAPLLPVISFEKTDFRVCLSECDTLDLTDSVTFANCSALDSTITGNPSSGYSIGCLSITFTEEGNYAFTMSAKKGNRTSNIYSFSVEVYSNLPFAGKGTIEDPYLISKPSDLKGLSDSILDYRDTKGLHFKQTCDISLAEYANWTPIGTFGIPFEGVYDGDGHEVNGIKIDCHESFQGLFGFSSGVIKNLSVRGDVNVTINPDYVYSHSFCAGLVGGLYNAGLVLNCKNYANVHGDAYVGGICGGICRSDEVIVARNQAMIVGCENYGTITGDDTYALNENAMYFGGIVGENLGIITANKNYGDVIVTGEKTRYVGGVCGLAHLVFKYGMYFDEDLHNYANNDNVNFGNVSGYHSVGGVFGANVLPSLRCINEGEVSGSVCVGGVSGLNGTASVHDNNYSVASLEECLNKGKVYVASRYGGGITSCSYFDVIDCANEGEVIGGQGSYYVGGVVGYQSDGDIKDCVNASTGSVKGLYGLGGIAGWSLKNDTIIENCSNNGNVSCLEDSNLTAVHIGGIVGMLGSSNTVSKCYNYGSVNGMGNRVAPVERWGGTGGIAGSIYSGSRVLNSENDGRVSGNQQVGGVAGYIDGSSSTLISDCINGFNGIIVSSHADPHLGCLVGRANYSVIQNNDNFGYFEVALGATHADYIVGSYSNATLINNNDYHA